VSNYAIIDRTVFLTIDDNGSVMHTSYGIRVYDDYGSTYENWVDDKATLVGMSPAELVERASGLNEIAAGILSSAEELRHPVYIDGRPYEAWPEEAEDDDDEVDD
jgi:hypothetical protein